MNITIKESLEHVCEVLNYFGIEYITAELLRRGKYDKKVKRKKVIIKYCFLINDLCLLYCFEFKRKFKPTYNEYIKKEILKVEEKFIKNNKRESDLNEKKEDIEEIEDDEEYFYEELDEDVHYFDDFHIISPLVILLLEYFQYPRLYQLIKCNFQMAKELLLCIGFLIDSVKLFENFDKSQLFYENFFKNLCSNKKNINKSVEKLDESNCEEYEFYHSINEAMLLLSNRPCDIEIFECKYFYNFLQNLKKKKNIDEDTILNVEEKKQRKQEFEKNEENIELKIKTKKEEGEKEKEYDDEEKETEENLTLDEYIRYDYSKYQENFLNFYNRKKYTDENELYFEDNNNIFLIDIIRNINKNCNKLIQLQNKISSDINKLQSYDKTRLMLLHRFNELISTYTEPHNAIINLNSAKETYKLEKLCRRGRKIDLSDNMLFSVSIDNEEEIKNLENKKLHNKTNDDNNKRNSINKKTEPSFNYSEFLDDINYDFLNYKITINEFYVLNNVSLYNKIIHIYKNGIDFFHYEKLRAVFWLWLQSIFSESLVLDEKIDKANQENTNINFFDINNNKFFYDNIEYKKNDDNLYLHVLSDLNDFEKNYKLLKEYLMHKGCTTGYNKISRNEKDMNTNKFNSITKYVNNLHIEFEAFYNYKKKSKSLCEETFVEFLEEKKNNMVINSNVEREDYTVLANIINKNLINIDKILKYQPILDFSKIVEGIKQQNFIKTVVDINKIELKDWNNMYNYHKKEKYINNKENIFSPSSNYIINLKYNSNYRINEKPSTYASTIFKYSDQFISNNDIYTFSDNINKKNEEYADFVKNKQNKCTHNFYHILRKVEKYMNCVTYNI